MASLIDSISDCVRLEGFVAATIPSLVPVRTLLYVGLPAAFLVLLLGASEACFLAGGCPEGLDDAFFFGGFLR